MSYRIEWHFIKSLINLYTFFNYTTPLCLTSGEYVLSQDNVKVPEYSGGVGTDWY